MGVNKSLEEHKFFAALLSDVQTSHSEVYSPRQMRLDCRKTESRIRREGTSFLTKTLARLGKAFDKALSGEVPLDCTGFRKENGTQLPKFLGGLFKSVFTLDGWILPTPCVSCIATIRQVLYLFYKYELPYEQDQEQEVIDQFIQTESELLELSLRLSQLATEADSGVPLSRQSFNCQRGGYIIARARVQLSRLFFNFDHRDINPCHGPGAVSTRERLWDKWHFRSVSPRITKTYPLDAYYYANLGHVVDRLQQLNATAEVENSARVVLVPKDSRGPRLISCEPLEFQWIQQGLSRAIVKHVESHPMTNRRVNFTDQRYNQRAALLGSSTGRYATLDLKEASDRVSVGLVHLLFPEPLLEALMNCRSLSTELPGGQKLNLNKYAPMGSALCFPVLALSIWAILMAGTRDADTRESILVYGDDVIVPTAYAGYAIELLEAFGLKVNRAKSCISGFFRESCGTDAYKGVNVTPARIRTVWSSNRCPHVYSSWIEYANTFHNKRYFNTYWYIAEKLFRVYGQIPCRDTVSGVPALVEVPQSHQPSRKRYNKALHRAEYKVWDIRSPSINREIDGWMMLHRFFVEADKQPSHGRGGKEQQMHPSGGVKEQINAQFKPPFAVRSYTKRGSVKLVQRWR